MSKKYILVVGVAGGLLILSMIQWLLEVLGLSGWVFWVAYSPIALTLAMVGAYLATNTLNRPKEPASMKGFIGFLKGIATVLKPYRENGDGKGDSGN